MELVALDMSVKQTINANSQTIALTALDLIERRTSAAG